MVNFIKKRLQVFVSSTYSDLIKERQAAVEAILTSGHIPAGMELFTSGDESQMEAIKQWIDESDVYLLILGGRYGSIEPNTGKSYTQLEYEYAVERGKPLFSCVIKDSAIDSRVKEHGRCFDETENPHKLKEFRTKVLTKMVRFWEDYKDIKITIGETLAQLSRREDLLGWMRPQKEADILGLADEIIRLSKENAQLRGQLSNNQPEPTICGVTFSQLKNILNKKGFLSVFLEVKLDAKGEILSGLKKEEGGFLCMIGLVEYNTFDDDYHLTDAGRSFLTRYLLEKSDEKDNYSE
ncbi:MAG: DUF4062 domain-containing protein [Candidatus Electronema sp. V4]|uniref:DUF4062 domain-containing protein n=1 Tax=Candidatus Electronema sp. V4 TaxID=3454756 RepID=UPI00405587AA